jgi:hypothetical protein
MTMGSGVRFDQAHEQVHAIAVGQTAVEQQSSISGAGQRAFDAGAEGVEADHALIGRSTIRRPSRMSAWSSATGYSRKGHSLEDRSADYLRPAARFA